MYFFSEKALRSALNKNFPHAYWLLGNAFAGGIGEQENVDEAIKLFEKGMSLGSPLCKRDLALLMLKRDHKSKERSACIRWLAECVSTGAGNNAALAALMRDERREYRGIAIRWLQHELVFHSDWQAGFILYTSILFPRGAECSNPRFLTDALLLLADEKVQARKALAFGLLCGALRGCLPERSATSWLSRGTTPNEMALSALVSMRNSGRRSPQKTMRAERALFLAAQSGSAVGNALLLRMSVQQLDSHTDPLAKAFVTKAALEHLANYPMHSDDETLRILIRWFGESNELRRTMESRLIKVLMRSSELGLTSSVVALARIALLDRAPAAATGRLRSAALRGHAEAIRLLADPLFAEDTSLDEDERLFWIQLNQLRELSNPKNCYEKLLNTPEHPHLRVAI